MSEPSTLRVESATSASPRSVLPQSAPPRPEPLYRLSDISLVLKTYSHDLRNTLNGMDLDLTLLSESSNDPLTQEAIQRLKATATEMERQVQGLTSKFGTESPFAIPVIQIAERWKRDAQVFEEGSMLEWDMEPTDTLIHGEDGLIRNLLFEMTRIARRIAPNKTLQASCICRDGHAEFKVAVAHSTVDPRRIQMQQGYWEALRRLAERCHAQLLPLPSPDIESFSVLLTLPTHQAPA